MDHLQAARNQEHCNKEIILIAVFFFLILVYQCGNGKTFSKIFTFKALPSGSDFGVRVALFGDMGSVNAQSLPRLLKDVQNDMYDAIFHVGKELCVKRQTHLRVLR